MYILQNCNEPGQKMQHISLIVKCLPFNSETFLARMNQTTPLGD